MRRSRTRRAGLGASPAAGHFMGVPTPLLVFALVAAAGVAYANSGPAEPTTQDVGNGTATGSSSGSSSGSTPATTTSGSSTTAATKKKRAAIVDKADPSLYVFVNSIGGEGIFDRLRAQFNILYAADGYGISRIRTLANHEFAGYATGRSWTAPDSGRVYIQLWQKINNIEYNYWIEQSQTVAMHGNGVTAAQAATNAGWGIFSSNTVVPMSAGTLSAIASFYFTNYYL